MRKTKRMIAGVTAVSLFGVTLIPVTYTPVYAEEIFTDGENRPDIDDKERDENQIMVSGNFKYSIDDDQAEIRGILDDSLEIIIIPDEIDGKTVTRICDGAFENCKEIKKFMLPDTLKIIGCRAFYNTEITEIDIPDSVTKIDTEAFSNCKNLESIDLSGNSNLKNIYTASFQNCISLSKVILPKTMNNIYPDAFHGCTSLTDITFPKMINTIDENAFSGCTSITELNLPEGTQEISTNAFKGCTGITKLSIPDKTGVIVTEAFNGCTGISELIIPEHVETIADCAFIGCTSIKKVIIKSLDIPYDFVCNTDDITFYVYSNSLAHKLAKENRANYVLLDQQKDYFRYVKSDDQITINSYTGRKDTVIIPETIDGLPVTQINQNAFEGDSFNEIIIPDCVKSIGEYAFSDCASLKSVKLPDGLTQLKDYVFSKCTSLENIEIPSSVEIIDETAFKECSNLKIINIPENFDMPGENITNLFSTCNSIISVTVDKKNKHFCSDDGIIYSKDKTKLICYPRGKIQESFIVPENVTEICCSAFNKCENLKNVSISGEHCSLSSKAFFDCHCLVSVDIGKSEDYINGSSFVFCPLLKKISVSDDNKAYVSQNGMLFSKDMTELIFYFPGYEEAECIVPDSVKKIHEYAFLNIQHLRTLIISEGISTFDDNIFVDNDSIEKIILPDSLTRMGDNTFSVISNLKYIEFGKRIKDINFSNWFWDDTPVKEIVIKNPECTFSEYNNYDPNLYKDLINGLTIFSYVNSSVEIFCRDKNINFSPLNEGNRDEIVYGDLNGDKIAELSDLVLLSQYLLKDIEFNQAQTDAADVQYDGCVDIADLARLKQFIMKDDVKLGK